MSDSENEILYSSESESEPEEVVEKKPVKRKTKPVVEPVVVVETKPTKKVRKPLDEDQKQVLRDRLAAAREKKTQLKDERKLAEAKALIKKKKPVKTVKEEVKPVRKKKEVKVVEPESPPPPKPKRAYKKKAPAVSPF